MSTNILSSIKQVAILGGEHLLAALENGTVEIKNKLGEVIATSEDALFHATVVALHAAKAKEVTLMANLAEASKITIGAYHQAVDDIEAKIKADLDTAFAETRAEATATVEMIDKHVERVTAAFKTAENVVAAVVDFKKD